MVFPPSYAIRRTRKANKKYYSKNSSKKNVTLLSGAGMEVHPVTVLTPLFKNSLHPENIAAQSYFNVRKVLQISIELVNN